MFSLKSISINKKFNNKYENVKQFKKHIGKNINGKIMKNQFYSEKNILNIEAKYFMMDNVEFYQDYQMVYHQKNGKLDI